jgi:hypothetical protein
MKSRFPEWLNQRLSFSAPLWAIGLVILVLTLIALD